MDGRDFGPPRSVHVPPPLLAGLAMEPHRLGAAAAAGRLPPSAGHLGASHPPSLHSGKFLPPALNLHPNHSYPPLPSSLYSSPYLSLGHLDPPTLSQHPLYDSHKEGFYLPASLNPLHLHPPSALPTTPSISTPSQRTSREGVRDRHYRGERDKDRERSREEQRPHSVVDLTQEARGEEERRARSSDREAAERERDRDAESQHQQKSYAQPSAAERRHSPPRPAGRFLGPETDRGGLDEVHHSQNANTISDRHRTSRSESASAATVHFSYAHPPAPQPSAVSLPHPSTPRELAREQRVSAPTYVPSVEVYDERTGPIQIASQARDNRTRDRERDRNREREGHRLAERSLTEHPRLSGDSGNQREEGSIICSNGSISSRGQDTSYSASQSRFSPETRDVPKHSLRLGMERAGAESKWNPISPLANYATSHMAALAAQHGHTHTSPHGLAAEEGAQRRFLDSSPLYRPGGGERVRGGASDPKEVSAMQSLIKYSGNFAAEGSGSSRHAADNRGAFGGLGSIRSGAAAGALRIPPPLKRDPERPDSARSFTREGEGEVRHPPVGIAVAVARQRDSGSSSKQPSGPSDAQRTILQTSIKEGHSDEEQGEERTHHSEDRFLAGRLERDQEKVLRESKELADITQMHPPSLSSGLTPSLMTPSLMTPNLMVTGGAALAGAGRWPPEPSTLTSHPWMSRPGAPPVWLSSSPYSLGPSSLHQSLPPGYPPPLSGSVSPAYQFARDPQSGQLIVIPTEHLPHYGGDVLERGGPVWSGVYPGSSLQHAAQLQLLFQQQMLRQTELLMIQQHTAQVLELQRNAQFVERLKVTEHRPETEDKADKRNTDPKPHLSSVASTSPLPVMHPHKRRPPSHSPTPSTSSLNPLPPVPSTVTALKSEDSGTRALPHPPTPLAHPASPRSASPPPSSPRQPKQEAAEEGEVGQREQSGARKPASGPFQGMYSGLPPGFPFQSITAPFGSALPPYHASAPAAAAADVVPVHPTRAPLSFASLPSALSRILDADVRPQKAECSKLPYLKQETGTGQRRHDVAPESPSPLCRSRSPVLAKQDREDGGEVAKPPLPSLQVSSPPRPECERLEEVGEEEKEGGPIKMEASSYPCKASYPLAPLTDAQPQAEVGAPEAIHRGLLPSHKPRNPLWCHESQRLPQHAQKNSQMLPSISPPPGRERRGGTPPSLSPHLRLSVALPRGPHGRHMLALLTASEMARARPCSPAPTLPAQGDTCAGPPDCSSTGALEMVALEGMALLSQAAQQSTEPHGPDQDLALKGLDCLLDASRQILLEAIEKQSHIDLPRTLDPSKRYSWRQKKEEPLFSKMALDVLDAVEVEYRVHLAELQKTYKEKQRDLSKLQRRRDKRERQQQEDDRRSLSRRGRGRPRKRKHLTPPLKMDSRPGKTGQDLSFSSAVVRVGRSVQYSEDSETGDGQRKRFRLSREEELEGGIGESWADQDPSTSRTLEGSKVKRSHLCEQEQLASDLDRALSLSQLSSL
uniref:Trinucleotide repeat containing 18 n=1 Tax=Tetraodon nigroviridis TaxID=99883 RepID=H3CNG8_TETNG